MSDSAAVSSGRLTSDTAIMARPGYLCSIILEGDATNAGNVIIYDNATTNSGTVLAKLLIKAGDVYQWFAPEVPIECFKGIYADVTGTGIAVIVHYKLG